MKLFMSKEMDLLKRILATGWLDHELSCEVEELLAQPEYEADRRSDPISKLRNLCDIQGRKGNYDVCEYMRGLYNGLELSLSIFEDRGPSYKEPIAQPEQPEQEPIAYVADPSVGFDVSRSTPMREIEIGTLNGTKWILGDESPEPMAWVDAKAWCVSIGQELPTRDVLLMAYLNPETRSEFANGYYWSSSEDYSSNAWLQGFANGPQVASNKNGSLPVRAVRAINETVKITEHLWQSKVALRGKKAHY